MKNALNFSDDVIVIVGGGAAGLMAAGTAASLGKKAVVFEKNRINGKKLLITGKGRCNVTNACDNVEDLIRNTPGNGKFLYSAFYTFSNEMIMSFFENEGLALKVERGNRVFPVSDKASDVQNALEEYVKKNNGVIVNEAEVEDIIIAQNGDSGEKKVTGVKVRYQQETYNIKAGSVIITTGGMSYPGTGSTGDGYRFAQKAGHSIVDPKPSLVPLVSDTEWIREVQGLSLKNVNISFFTKESYGSADKRPKPIYSEQGEMLFTHFGVSGPVILSASRHLLKYGYKNIVMKIDLKPALDEKTLDDRILRDFEKYSRKNFSNSLGDLLPSGLIPVVVRLSDISPEKKVDQITSEERKRLLHVLKGLTLTIDGARPIREAIVTAGGVNTKEVDPSTMQSKLVRDLFFAGEVLDVDAYTGGYNLTIAFSTAYLAALNA